MARAAFFRGYTKAQLTDAIRREIGRYEFNEPFACPLIADLIYEHHWYCSVHKLRPSLFIKRERPGAAYDFAACFDGRWNLVSWTHCIHPRSDHAWLRNVARPFVRDYKRQHTVCEVCRVQPATECDHVDPEFDEIATAAIATLSHEVIRQYVSEMDWWASEPFALPDDSPAVAMVREAHRTGTLQAVCKACHLKNASERKLK